MKKVLLLLMTIAMVAVSASATKIYVCGTKITGTTSFNAGGGTVSFNASSNTLTINNVYYLKSGSSNNGISVDECDANLTINLVGSVTFGIGDADAVLLKSSGKSATVNVSGYAHFYTSSSGHAGLKLQSQNVTITGSGQLDIEHVNSSTSVNSVNAVKGGTGNENITFKIKKCTLKSNGARLYNLNNVTFNPTGSFGSDDYSTYITFTYYSSSSSSPHASSISNFYKGTGVKLLKPIVYYNESLNFLTVNNFSNEAVVADVSPVAVFNSSYFPDANFRSYLLGLYPKGYINTSDVNARTSMIISSKSISDLQGINYFSKLTYLDCSYNNISSLSYLPNTITELHCNNNQITSLSSSSYSYIPSNIRKLYCQNNKLSAVNGFYNDYITYLDCSNNQITELYNIPDVQELNCSNNKLSGTFQMSYHEDLKTLNISNNPYITTLEICNNSSLTSVNVTNCSSMTRLDCYGNKISSLNLSGCSALKILMCHNNQLTSLSNLPNTLQQLGCSNNKFSGTFSLTGRSALTYLNVSYNPYITILNVSGNSLATLYVWENSEMNTLYCDNNQITALELTGCTKLVELVCGNNQLDSRFFTVCDLSDCQSLQALSCSNNKFTTATIAGFTKLKILDVRNNTQLTTLNCYNNALTNLMYSGCTALKTLDCAVNKLASLPALPSSVTKFNCSANQLTSMPALPNGLLELSCAYNKLTSLSVQGLNSLTKLEIYGNQIKETAMGNLVNSMRTIPAGSTGDFKVLGSSDEGNVITTAQVKTARNKRWYPKKNVNGYWVDIPVNIPGDVNNDGLVSSVDVTVLYNYLLNNDSQHLVNGDQDGDGIITSADIMIVYNLLLGN